MATSVTCPGLEAHGPSPPCLAMGAWGGGAMSEDRLRAGSQAGSQAGS